MALSKCYIAIPASCERSTLQIQRQQQTTYPVKSHKWDLNITNTEDETKCFKGIQKSTKAEADVEDDEACSGGAFSLHEGPIKNQTTK